MEQAYDSVTFEDSIKDTFPFVESTILKLDNNLAWWKKNYEKIEQLIAEKARDISSNPITIRTKLIIYNGPDENVKTVTWSGPALEFSFLETSSSFVRSVKKSIGNTWGGHKLITSENRLVILFE